MSHPALKRAPRVTRAQRTLYLFSVERLTMSKKPPEYQRLLDSVASSDVSQLVTTRLRPPVPRAATHAQQVAQHKAEAQRLLELADVLENAITALVFRLHITTDKGLIEALEHSRADLQRYKDELDSLREEHQQAALRLQQQ